MALKELSLQGSEPLFIGGWFLPNLSICDELIDFWRINSEFQRPGIAGGTGMDGTRVDTDIKDSIDITLTTQNPPPVLKAYAVQLQEVMDAYKEKFYWAGAYSSYALMEPVNIQFYKPGAGFKQWHTERTESHFPSVTRHLVFMTYLNDVHDQGETEFFYQKIKVKHCYNCLKPCNPATTPYCITEALIQAVKGNIEEGLVFTGVNGYRNKKIVHVSDLIHELFPNKEIYL
jgi:hypothetical protein